MRQAVAHFDMLAKMPGKNKKLLFLEASKGKAMEFLFDTALNPFRNYGATNFDDGVTYRKDVPDLLELEELRSKLETKVVTGNAARLAMQNVLLCEDATARKWLIRVFKKNLRMGIAVGLVNKVYPNLIPVFDVGKCEVFDDTVDPVPIGSWIAEPKYDGLRCLTFIDEVGNITFVSRNNKPLFNLADIEEQLMSLNLKDVVLDGEMLAKDWNDSISVLHSQGAHEKAKTMQYFMFDMLTTEEWETKRTAKLAERKKRILTAFASLQVPSIQIVPYYHVGKELSQLQSMLKGFLRDGFEGMVLKDMEAEYPFGRSKVWLKYKPFETYDVEVVDLAEGTGRNQGRLGAFVCLFKGKRIRVGSGLSDEQRNKLWLEREELIGKVLECKCQEVTKDGSLRFPVFMRIRDDKDASEVTT